MMIQKEDAHTCSNNEKTFTTQKMAEEGKDREICECDCSILRSFESSRCIDARHATKSTNQDEKENDSLKRGKRRYHKDCV